MNVRAYSESAEQQAVVRWCRLSGYPYDMIYAVENEGRTSPQAGARAKAMGKLAGVCDLFLPVARRGYHGLYVEMKSAKGRLSAAQLGFMDAVTKEGYKAVVCFGAEQAIEELKKYCR